MSFTAKAWKDAVVLAGEVAPGSRVITGVSAFTGLSVSQRMITVAQGPIDAFLAGSTISAIDSTDGTVTMSNPATVLAGTVVQLLMASDTPLSAAALVDLEQRVSGYADTLGGGIFLNAKSMGVTGDGVTDDTDASRAAYALVAAVGGTLFFPAGRYLITGTGLAFTASHVTVRGEGKGATILHYTGTGTGLQWGPDHPAASIANCQSTLEDLTIEGTSAGACGLRLSKLNDFAVRQVAVNLFTAGKAIEFTDCNSIDLLNTDATQSLVGVNFRHQDDSTDLITWVQGQITGNQTAVTAVNADTVRVRLIDVVIAATAAAPAVIISNAVDWEIACWFEGNAAGVCVVQLGDGSNYAVSTKVRSYFGESTAIDYAVQIQRGIANEIAHNHNSSAGTGGAAFRTAFLRLETNATKTKLGPNATTSATPWLSDGSGPVMSGPLTTATAGGSYGATEQAMLQKAYDILRKLEFGASD